MWMSHYQCPHLNWSCTIMMCIHAYMFRSNDYLSTGVYTCTHAHMHTHLSAFKKKFLVLTEPVKQLLLRPAKISTVSSLHSQGEDNTRHRLHPHPIHTNTHTFILTTKKYMHLALLPSNKVRVTVQ